MKSIKFSIELARTSKRKWGEVICTGRGWGGTDEERKCYLWL